MKKNFLFKGVSVLGAMLLLATSVMPGLGVSAAWGDDPSTDYSWDYTYDEASWNAAYNTPGSALKHYYEVNPDEDVECSDSSEAGWHYGTNADKVDGVWKEECNKHSWRAALYASKLAGNVFPKARFPKVTLKLPDPFYGTIAFKYGEDAAIYPWGQYKYNKIGGWGQASIPEEIASKYAIGDEGSEEFDPYKLVITIAPATLKDAEWNFIRNEDTWNEAFQIEDGALKRYYERYPDEDRRCEPNDYKNESHWGTCADKGGTLNGDVCEGGSWDETKCPHNWLGAINAPGATYPWAVVKLDKGDTQTVKINYDDGNDIYPEGEAMWLSNGGFDILSIPSIFGAEYKLDLDGKTSFNPELLDVKLVKAGEAIELKMAPTYTITYTDGIDGVNLFDKIYENVLAGKDTPAAPDTNVDGYTFVAWTPAVAEKVTGDATYTATWSCADNYHEMSDGTCDSDGSTYKVIWKNGETTLETDENVEYDTVPSYDGATPTKAADSSYTYSFKGWSKDGTTVITLANEKVTEDVTYTALFTSTARTSSSGGGGSRTKTTTTDDAKANTGDTATVDDKNAEDKNDETKANEPKTAVDANNNGTASTAISFSQEFIDAYKFAHENGITTKDSIEEADMYGPLTRIAMAKMLSYYAINVLKQTPDTNKVCSFRDVDAQLDADYDHGVTLSCQLGIMGIGIEDFRPNDEVTRAEFGTALSRMLFGLADGEGEEWYKTHLDKLMNEAIITNDNPNLKELRGYVMIMLMRSAQ